MGIIPIMFRLGSTYPGNCTSAEIVTINSDFRQQMLYFIQSSPTYKLAQNGVVCLFEHLLGISLLLFVMLISPIIFHSLDLTFVLLLQLSPFLSQLFLVFFKPSIEFRVLA